MTRSLAGRRRDEATVLPEWVKPQLTKLVAQPPEGPGWLHEIKFDGYRMHARLDGGALQPLAVSQMPLAVPPPRDSRFGSPLVLSRVHWVRPELVAEVKYLTWTDDNLLRQVVYEGLREDKPAAEVRREMPHPKSAATVSAVRSRRSS
jgi:ATP-dependent DNA ligase